MARPSACEISMKLALVLLGLLSCGVAWDVARTPPMGWNSWFVCADAHTAASRAVDTLKPLLAASCRDASLCGLRHPSEPRRNYWACQVNATILMETAKAMASTGGCVDMCVRMGACVRRACVCVCVRGCACVSCPCAHSSHHSSSPAGLSKVGYEYVNSDDCWMLAQRDANGALAVIHWNPSLPVLPSTLALCGTVAWRGVVVLWLWCACRGVWRGACA
jgi:hypothetical protein